MPHVKQSSNELHALDSAQRRAYKDSVRLANVTRGDSPELSSKILDQLHEVDRAINVRLSGGESELVEQIRKYLNGAGVVSKRGIDQPPSASDAFRYCIMFTALMLDTVKTEGKKDE